MCIRDRLQNNRHVTTVTRDRASAYAKAVEEVLPECMQIADRFHLHQNLLEAVKNIVNATVPVDIKIPIEHAPSPVTEEEDAAMIENSKKNARGCG